MIWSAIVAETRYKFEMKPMLLYREKVSDNKIATTITHQKFQHNKYIGMWYGCHQNNYPQDVKWSGVTITGLLQGEKLIPYIQQYDMKNEEKNQTKNPTA